MTDSVNSTTSAPTPEADGASVLPMDVRRRLADLARVPDQERENFYNVIQLPVRLVREVDRREVGTKAGRALARAAASARALQEAFHDLNSADYEWVEKLWSKTPRDKKWLLALPRTIDALANLFSIAVGKSPPQVRSGPSQRGRRKGDVKDLAFREFVHYLLIVTEEWCGGVLTFDKNYESGTLVDAIEILRRYLPNGVVPRPLPFMTIERVKRRPGHYSGLPEIDFFRAD